jgi:histidinol-phosphate aminotransferase
MSDNAMQSFERREFLRWIGAAGIAANSGILAAPLLSTPLLADEAADAGDSIAHLNYNENPNGPCPSARRAITEGIAGANRYPGPERAALIDMLAGMHGLDRERILTGAGSTELLRAAVASLAAGGRLVMADPTYEDPIDYSKPFDVTTVRVPLDDEGAHDLPAMEHAAGDTARVIYVCNPNNPTGTIVDGKALEKFVRRMSRRATVLVDEAYHEYVDDPRYASMVPLVAEGLPIVVTRTFSKIHGMAGLRIGYALCGSKELIGSIRAHMTFVSANVLAVHAAMASLEDRKYQEYCRRENARARKHLTAALEKRGYTVFPSQTNFVMFRLGSDVGELGSYMTSRGVRIGRRFPPLTEHCRVSLGTMKGLDRFIGELDRWRQAAAA